MASVRIAQTAGSTTAVGGCGGWCAVQRDSAETKNMYPHVAQQLSLTGKPIIGNGQKNPLQPETTADNSRFTVGKGRLTTVPVYQPRRTRVHVDADAKGYADV